MEENIEDYGRMENKTEKENFIIQKRIRGREVSGMKEKELDGLLTTLHLLQMRSRFSF